MRVRLLSLLLIVTSLSITSASSFAEESSSTQTESKVDNETREAKLFFDDIFDDYQQELEIAKDEGKKGILVMYEMENCPFCARMKSTVLNQGKVQDFYRDNFRIFSVDIDGDLQIVNFKGEETTQKEFSLSNRVRATPVFQFYDLNGETLKNGRLTGATKDSDEFLLLGKYIIDKQNETQSFSRYKRSQKQENAE